MDVTHTHLHHADAHPESHGAAPDKHAGHDPETFRRRFWWSLLLTVPVIVSSEMVMEWFGYELDGLTWVGPVLGTVVFVWGGWPFLVGAVTEIRSRAPGMMLLVAMAITVAWASSMASTIGWIDLEFWWELAALVTIMLLGHWQEMRAIGHAQGALAALAALLPDQAEIVHGDDVHEVPVNDLAVGDIVLIRPGGRVPADGSVISGTAEFDESMITGESRPVPRSVGDRVVAGTISTDSAVRVRVEAVGDDTRSPVSSGWWRPRSRRARGRKYWPIASPPCSSTSRRPPPRSRSWPGVPRATGTPRSRQPSLCS